MMIKGDVVKIFSIIFSILFLVSVSGEGTEVEQTDLHQKIEIFSRREGYDIATYLKNHSEWIDLASVIHGIQDYMSGETPQGVLQKEGGVSYCKILIQLFEQSAKRNLEKAQAFLQNLKDKPSLHSLENGKVWYEVVVEGKQKACVQKDSSPLLHYSIVPLDGEGLVDTHMQGQPYRVPLTETIPGFAKGVEGMCVGERRKIYIHPDLGYGKVGYVPPNSLLIVDVEVISL
jgi:peptidylprolyl isomerase